MQITLQEQLTWLEAGASKTTIKRHTHTYIHTHTHIYIYIYIYIFKKEESKLITIS